MPLNDFTLEVLHALRLLLRVSAKNMFGGAGIYCDGVFFGLTANERFYLRVDDATRPRYEAAGMSYFQPWPDKPEHVMRTYYEVPAHIQRRPEELCQWAGEALEIARRHKKPPRKKSQPKRNTTTLAPAKKVPAKQQKSSNSRRKIESAAVKKTPSRRVQKKSGSR